MTTPRRRLLHRRFGPWTRHQCLAQVAPTSRCRAGDGQGGRGRRRDARGPSTRPSTRASRSARRRCGRPSSRRRVRWSVRARGPRRGTGPHRTPAHTRAQAAAQAESAPSRHRGRRGAGSRAAARGRSAGSCLRRGAGAGAYISTTPPASPERPPKDPAFTPTRERWYKRRVAGVPQSPDTLRRSRARDVRCGIYVAIDAEEESK